MTDDKDLGESTAAGRAIRSRLARAMRGPWMSDLAFKVMFSAVYMVAGVAVSYCAVGSVEATQAIVVALVMHHFVAASSAVWSKRSC